MPESDILVHRLLKMATSFQRFIDSLDPKTLPRVLQIQAGVYYEDSPCEQFGNERTLSTEEVMQIIGFKVKKVTAHIYSRNEDKDMLDTMDLPPDFSGLFRLIADETPYCSIGELTRELYVRPSQFGLLRFRSDIDLEVGNFTVSKDEQILIRDLKEVNEVMSVNCEVLIKSELHSFDLPLSYEGKFYECQDEKTYTLNEILSWKIPSNRKRNVVLSDVMEISDISKLCPKGSEWFMVLKPVYEVEAMLQFRHDIICLLSDLDIDVIDITHRFDMKYFSQMVTTHEIFERNSKEFPMMVEIISSPVTKCIFSNLLMPGKKIIIHKKHQSDRVIASEFSSYSPKKHFLIPSNYKGKFKRKARMFSTVYDLRIAKNERDDLHVVATKAFYSPYKEFSSICVGDQFLVKTFQSKEMLFEGKKTVVDALVCIKMTETPFTEVSLPLYVEGGFVEVVHDKKKYYLTELCKSFQLPLNVKVSIRDLFAVGEDILATTSVLQLEEQITDSYLLVSTLNRPEEVWELPVQRQNLTVQLISSFQGKTFSSPTRTNIEEVNEDDYYMLRRYENQVQHPPPRPPKTPLCAEPATKIPEINVIPKSSSSAEENGGASELLGSSPEDTLIMCTEKKISVITKDAVADERPKVGGKLPRKK